MTPPTPAQRRVGLALLQRRALQLHQSIYLLLFPSYASPCSFNPGVKGHSKGRFRLLLMYMGAPRGLCEREPRGGKLDGAGSPKEGRWGEAGTKPGS